MAITGVVRGPHETFVVNHGVTAVLADRRTLLAEDEQGFARRAREVLGQAFPGHSNEFGDYVCRLAWSRRDERTEQIELTATSLVRVEELVAGLPDDNPGVGELRTALAAARKRLGVTDEPTAATPA